MTDPTSPPTAALPGSAPPAVRAVRVEVVTGPDAGACLRGDSERIVVGTHRSADLVLTDRTVSRFHLELVIEDEAVHLRDLGSRNGTLLDGVELESARLRGPTIVAIGKSELRIDLLGDLVPVVLAPQERLGGLVGVSAAMRLAFGRLHQAALRDAHVLIEGERGTGKALAAVAVHELASHRDGPLDVIDCGASALEIEAQLASGAIERCRGGTLVLDDVGSLVRGTQRVLIRALEGRAGTRVIALSRRNLQVDVNAERFAPELFELLAGARIRMPPLREHTEDIPLLVARFVDRLGATGTPAAAQLLAADSIEQLRAAPWPGNVRELRALVERTITSGGLAEPELAPPLIDGSLPLRDARERWVRYFERSYVAELLERTGGNVSAAAQLAGVDRVYMHRLITRVGLRAQLTRDRQ
jgi:DNA-binding NtrC family response regulator